jgi:putative transposase
MTTELKRYYGRGDLHFLTFSCCRRLPFLANKSARNLSVRELARVPREYDFLLLAYVVMPEHVHLLLGEPRKGTPSTVLQVLKQRVSRKMRKKRRSPPPGQLRLNFPEPGKNPRSFWQARFYDFNVQTRRKMNEKIEYIHRNPIDRGLVAHPKDWQWSSWGFYARVGTALLSMDII